MKKILPILLVFLMAFIGSLPVGASSMEDGIKSRICSQANLDPDLVGVILCDEAGTRLMLTFIYINQRTLQSNLNPGIKDAIRPYQNKNALLVLATAARGTANFNPYGISFNQQGFKYQVKQADIRKITADFETGLLDRTTSRGIVLLKGIDSSKQFGITYKNSQHNTTLALKTISEYQQDRGKSPASEVETGRANYVWGFFKYGLANLLWSALLSFLVVV